MSTPLIEPSDVDLRDLTTLDACRGVVAVQEIVWGRDGETVPASILSVSVKRGGILIGAFSGNTMIGFVWSLAGVRDGLSTQWSHMLAVLPEFRGARVAERLKMAQRDRALAAGVTLMEWTFDPLQAANAHFNLHVLGAVGAGYGVNVYGSLSGHLHRGTPTDRLFAEWWIAEPHVVRRLATRDGGPSAGRLFARSAEVLAAPQVLRSVTDGPWARAERVAPDWTARRVLVAVPPKFSDLQQQAGDLAMAWRLTLRDVLTEAFAHGYRAVDFYLNRERGGGTYLLARTDLENMSR